MSLVREEYCQVLECNNVGEKAHLVTRATLPKSEWDNPALYTYLCRKHHSEQHNIGINTFCMKYGLMAELGKARAFVEGMSI